jgi:hypothetical protein
MANQRVEIVDSAFLYRRFIRWYKKKNGELSKAAFLENDKVSSELSVDLAEMTTPETALSAEVGALPGMGLAEIAVEEPREMKLSVVHNPLPNNHAHSLICGMTAKSQAKELAKRASIIVHPPER